MQRNGGRYGAMGTMRCRDGWVQLVGMTPGQWDALAASPEAGDLADSRIATAAARVENLEFAAAAIQAWCEARCKADVVAILAALGAPVGAYATPGELLGSPQLSHRAFFREIDDGGGGRIRIPGPPYHFSVTPVEISSAPVVGSRTGFSEERAAKSISSSRPSARGHPYSRLHLGRCWSVCNLSSRPLGRRSDQSRVESAS